MLTNVERIFFSRLWTRHFFLFYFFSKKKETFQLQFESIELIKFVRFLSTFYYPLFVERPAHLLCFPCWVQLHFHDPRSLQSCLLYKSWYSNAFFDIAKQRIFAWSTYPDLELLLKWKVLLAAYHTTLSFQSRSLHCSGLYFQWRIPSCMFSYKGLIHFLEPRNR